MKNKNIISLLMVLYLIILIKSMFFPITGGDSVAQYSVYSKYVFYEKQLPPSEMIKYEWSAYGFPQFLQLIAAHNVILNGDFDDFYLKFLPPLFSFLSLLLIYKLSIILFHQRLAGLFAVLLVLGNPSFVYLSIEFVPDIAVTFYFLLSVLFIFHFFIDQKKRNLVFSSIFMAFAAMSKLNAFVLFAVMLMLLYSKSLNSITRPSGTGILKHSIKTMEVPVIHFLFPFIVTCSPYLIWNIINLGDPLYPYIFGKFGSDSIIYQNPAQYHLTSPSGLMAEITQAFVLFFLRTKTWITALFIISALRIFNKDFGKLGTEFFLTLLAFFSVISIYFLSLDHTSGAIVRYILPGMCLINILAAYVLIDIVNNNRLSKIETFIIVGMAFLTLAYITVRWFLVPSIGLQVLYSFVNDSSGDAFTALSAILILILFFCGISSEKFRSRTKKSFIILVALLVLLPSYTFAFDYRYPMISEKYPYYVISEQPSDDEILGEKYGPDFIEMVFWINNNIPDESVIVTYTLFKYYFNDVRVLNLQSLYFEDLYFSTNFSEALGVLESKNVDYFLEVPKDSKALWMEKNWLFNECPVRANFDNDRVQLVQKFGEVELYRFIYEKDVEK